MLLEEAEIEIIECARFPLKILKAAVDGFSLAADIDGMMIGINVKRRGEVLEMDDGATTIRVCHEVWMSDRITEYMLTNGIRERQGELFSIATTNPGSVWRAFADLLAVILFIYKFAERGS